ncbi:unnamed protein product [Blepharisma stoltei]|uniref:Uncharacterized protein n=1 Tax=Blepharisma stoltei TaxID=1481888 RepID=A0AAU9K1U7_9CILI|nr:unnamed protein product [Blepharisma stoltei]
METSFIYPEMATQAARVETFNKNSWPHKRTSMLHPVKLAEAGFFFDQAPDGNDRCVCFSCGLSLVNWDPNDNPFQDHLKHIENNEAGDKSHCTYMELLKQYNPGILGLSTQKKLYMSMDGLPEIEERYDALEIRENFNKRRDFLKSILVSTLLEERFRRKA